MQIQNTWVEENNILLYLLKLIIIGICTCITSNRLLNRKINIKTKLILLVWTMFISFICVTIKTKINFFNLVLILNLSISIIFSIDTKNRLDFSILINTISLCINYCLYCIATILGFIIYAAMQIKEEYINLITIITIYIILLNMIFRMKKFMYGIRFLKEKATNNFFNILILNISIIILFSFNIFINLEISLKFDTFITLIIFSIIMFITIQKSLELYYKQKLQKRELEETREELKKVKEERDELQKENLKISKEKHSIAYNQEKLEYKINQLLLKNETSEELQIKDKIEEISNKIRNEDVTIELTKTGIEEIDDMLKYMQAKCKKNNINFELQVKGNIHHMINKYIEKKDLEILLADHIKNAIIAINYSKNINKSILVKLGIIDGVYSVYFYDTGTEFNKETLLNLGKKPSTTHADNGGTGMGFLNTFDKLKKYKASITINEYGKPCEDNYTKYIAIKFDNKNEYQIHSYRFAEIKLKI